MIDEARQVSFSGSINNGFLIHTEKVAWTNSHLLVSTLPDVSYGLSNHLSNILRHHFISCNGLHGEQTPIMNTRFGKSKLFFTYLMVRSAKAKMNFWRLVILDALMQTHAGYITKAMLLYKFDSIL